MSKRHENAGSIGRFDETGEACPIDLPRLLESRLLVQATSGGGKSWLLRRIFEQTAGKVQQIIIDPDGEFASLRERFDYVIAAPHDGDALAHPKTAQLLARRLLETGVSAILDIYDLKKQERQSFVRLFCEALIDAPKSLWHPVLVAIDEIHVFCPEKGKAESTSAVIDLATRGRKRGFSLIAATQRLAKFNKDAAAEMLNKLIGRTGLDVDVRRAQDELGFASYREALDELRGLNPGEFFAFGPALSRSVQALKVGPVLTSHAEAGQRMLKAPPKPTAAIRAVLPKLADLPKEAATEARTLAELRQELTAVRRELAAAKRSTPVSQVSQPTAPPSREALAAAETRGFKRAEEAYRAQILKDKKALKTTVLSAVQSAFAGHEASLPTGPAIEPRGSVEPARHRHTQGARSAPEARSGANYPSSHPRSHPSSRAQRRSAREPVDSAGLSGPERRILNAIAWLETMIVAEAYAQPAVAFLAGYAYGGGAFNNPRGRLHAQGLVEYVPGEKIRLTESGRSLAEAPEAPLTEQELHERILQKLPGPERRILKPLLESYPQPMDGRDVAEAANYVYGAGSFNNPRGRLRSLGLIEYLGNGELIAARGLFPQSSAG